MFCRQYKPAFSTAKLAQNAADLPQTIDLVEGIRPPLGGQWRSPLDDDNGGAGSFAIDRAGEIRLTVEQRTGRTPHRPALVLPVASISMCQLALWSAPRTDRARAIIAVLMRPRLPPLVPLMVDVVGPRHGATDEDHPDQIDDQPMDVRCLGHQVHIYSPGRA